MEPTTDSRVADVAERLRRTLVTAAGADWARISLDVTATAEVYELAVAVTRADGSGAAAEPLGQEAIADLRQLRESLYQEGRGTWFSARLVVHRSAEPELSFNFDEDPKWWPELHPATFVRDLELFPRSDEHIPSWLRARLNEGASLEAEHQETNGTGAVGEQR